MTAPKPAITLADEAIAQLRTQVRSLLGQIDADTGRKPAPDGVIPPGKRNPGPVWKPVHKWAIRVITEDEALGEYVYVTTPLDWDGDFSAMELHEARALAMSLLAACDWAENPVPGEPRLYPAFNEDDQPTGRSFICGGIR